MLPPPPRSTLFPYTTLFRSRNTKIQLKYYLCQSTCNYLNLLHYMTIGLIKERKTPPDRRVVFSPDKLAVLKQHYPQLNVVVEPSDIRIFSDDQYKEKGFTLSEDLSGCDVLLGVKEVPVENLIPHKKYFFFSHTIKKQPYNRSLLKAVLDKNIQLYDHETITDTEGE